MLALMYLSVSVTVARHQAVFVGHRGDAGQLPYRPVDFASGIPVGVAGHAIHNVDIGAFVYRRRSNNTRAAPVSIAGVAQAHILIAGVGSRPHWPALPGTCRG